MITRVDERLREEARRFDLRSGCEHCAHFDVARISCAHGYPIEPHHAIELASVDTLLFCKEFELA